MFLFKLVSVFIFYLKFSFKRAILPFLSLPCCKAVNLAGSVPLTPWSTIAGSFKSNLFIRHQIFFHNVSLTRRKSYFLRVPGVHQLQERGKSWLQSEILHGSLARSSMSHMKRLRESGMNQLQHLSSVCFTVANNNKISVRNNE